MKQQVRTMLESTYGLFQQKFQDSYSAWDRFIEFLAVDHNPLLFRQIDHKFEWLFDDSELIKKLEHSYNPQLLGSDYYDHLGDMYLEKVVSKYRVQRLGQFLTPESVADMLAQMTIEKTDEPVNILDPAVGSGRLLMAAHKVAPNSRLFGVDNDLRMIRLAMTNFAIYRIHGYLLHADSLRHEIDIGTPAGRDNWRYANRWQSQMHKLQPIGQDSQTELRLTRGQKRQTED